MSNMTESTIGPAEWSTKPGAGPEADHGDTVVYADSLDRRHSDGNAPSRLPSAGRPARPRGYRARQASEMMRIADDLAARMCEDIKGVLPAQDADASIPERLWIMPQHLAGWYMTAVQLFRPWQRPYSTGSTPGVKVHGLIDVSVDADSLVTAATGMLSRMATSIQMALSPANGLISAAEASGLWLAALGRSVRQMRGDHQPGSVEIIGTREIAPSSAGLVLVADVSVDSLLWRPRRRFLLRRDEQFVGSWALFDATGSFKGSGTSAVPVRR